MSVGLAQLQAVLESYEEAQLEAQQEVQPHCLGPVQPGQPDVI